jgi:hypothetical protein
MRIFRKFTTQWLQCLHIKNTTITRQLLHHWIKNYENKLEEIISFEEAHHYWKNTLNTIIQQMPKKTLSQQTTSHTEVLQILEEIFGQKNCKNLLQSDQEFFSALCEIIRYQKLCHSPNTDYSEKTPTNRLLSGGKQKL